MEGFTKDEFFEVLFNVEKRKKWDTVIQEEYIVETNEKEGWEIEYMSIKVKLVYLLSLQLAWFLLEIL